MYIDNIVKDPKNEKFRNINKNFKAFREKINTLPGVTSLLYLIGFSENGETLTLAEPDEAVRMEIFKAQPKNLKQLY